jgi:diacylglycerol kinase (ATP)
MQQTSIPVHRRLIRAFGDSCAGLAAAARHEAAFRYELVVSLVVVPLGLWLGRSGVERALLIASWLAVPLVELLNSAIEAVVDRIGPQRHELAGRAKDFGSAAVLVAIGIAITVWALILADQL